jgi:hypothetical protein
MKGMYKWLWEVFAVVVVAYCLYLSPVIALDIAAVVFFGGGLLLTLVAYAAAKYSMPWPANFWLQLWYPDSKNAGEKMSPSRLFFYRMIYRSIRPKDGTDK